MLIGLQFFRLASVEWDLYLVMLVGFAAGAYCYHIFREAHLAYVGILSSFIGVALCELISIFSMSTASGEFIQIIAIVIPVFEYFLLPFAIGQLVTLLAEYRNKRIHASQEQNEIGRAHV